MTIGITANNSTVVAGLGTASFTVVTPGPYTCAFQSFLPYKASGSPGDSSVTTGGSSLSVVIKQGSTTLLTVNAPAPTQPTMAGSVVMLCAAADVITLEITSSDVDDSQLNAVKTVINLYQGVE